MHIHMLTVTNMVEVWTIFCHITQI